MYEKLVKFVDLIFKSFGIIIIVITLTFIVVIVKSCGNTMTQINKIQNTKSINATNKK